MEEKFIELFQLLIELKENKNVPELYKKELERNIHFMSDVLKNPTSEKKKKNLFVKVLAFILKYLDSP